MALPVVDWAAYAAVVNDAMSQHGQHPITWERTIRNIDRNAEGSNRTTTQVNLVGLLNFDDWRTWPVNAMTKTGQVDKEHLTIMFSKAYLSVLGYLGSSGNFDWDPGLDRFIINGIRYKAGGDTDLANAGPTSLLVLIILQREEIGSTEDPRP